MLNQQENLKKVENILISLPEPPSAVARTVYTNIEKKYNVKFHFINFINIQTLEAKEFRRQRINLPDFTSVILTSKNSIDHYFALCEEMKIKVSPEMKYFCQTENIALYMQKYIVYRKRKVTFGLKSFNDLKPLLLKNKKKEKYLVPASNLGKKEVSDFLKENEFDFQEAVMYKTVYNDLKFMEEKEYDIIACFSPAEIHAIFHTFPEFKQGTTRIAAFGDSTCKAVEEKGLQLNIKAPTPEAPSMIAAIEQYLQKTIKTILT